MAIVEDKEGTAVLLQLYNQPEESKVSMDYILQNGDVCVVKEPFFKASTSDGSYSLRVDHVSDIIWLQDNDDRIPLKWRKRALSVDEISKDLQIQGNAAVHNQNWAEAEHLYTKAIRTAKTPEEEQLAYLNRSLSNLRLDRPEKALHDARKGNGSEKAQYREAKALYALGKFSPCLEKLTVLVRSDPTNSVAWAEIRRVRQRLREEEKRTYLFSSMHTQAGATTPLVDCATYVGSVAVRDSPGRGKGVFTTKRVGAGELLLCEKALAYCYDDYGRATSGQASLITQVVQKIYHGNIAAEVITHLHHGEYRSLHLIFLAAKIIQLNSFGAPRTSYESTITTMFNHTQGRSVGPVAQNNYGLWPLASRFNHSCITNCRRSFIGDMQIVRACGDIEAGAELHFGYTHPLPNQTYAETQEGLKHWGFVCSCSLCLDKKSTPLDTVNKRRDLYGSLKPLLQPSDSIAPLTRATKIIEDLRKTYTAQQDVPRVELWSPYLSLGKGLIDKNNIAEGLEMLLRGLEALGYIIVACPPRNAGNRGDKKPAMLEIKRWGLVNEYIVEPFSLMMIVYRRLAPELCEVAKGNDYSDEDITEYSSYDNSVRTSDTDLTCDECGNREYFEYSHDLCEVKCPNCGHMKCDQCEEYTPNDYMTYFRVNQVGTLIRKSTNSQEGIPSPAQNTPIEHAQHSDLRDSLAAEASGFNHIQEQCPAELAEAQPRQSAVTLTSLDDDNDDLDYRFQNFQCEKFDDHEFTPIRKNDFPGVTNTDYDYTPRPMHSIPPISEHEFRKRFYTCHTPRPLRHWYHKCKAMGHSYEILKFFPKKKSELEESGDTRQEFWGIYAREMISLRRVLFYNFVSILPMLVFFMIWILPTSLGTDLQNPSVPFTMMIGMLSLFWSIFLSSLQFGISR
ncbi:hypothetical protein GGR54DRAFT_640658 [Hypoxylon sp. NC1633]|nr:hypothetical protein GGR54DRAFT_640658 [Hypoxylon sp. NC1633]